MSLAGVVTVLTSIGGLAGLAALISLPWVIRKIRSEATHQEVTTALAEDAAVDDHWESIIQMQTNVLLQPALARIGALETRVQDLEAQVARAQARYWVAVRALRMVYRWIDVHLPNATPPDLAAELAADVAL